MFCRKRQIGDGRVKKNKVEQFRTKLKNSRCVGIFSKSTDSGMIEAAGFSGLDFIILDTEHGPIGQETLQNHVRATDNTPMLSIVRVNGHDADMIGSMLDSGADGVQVPNVGTAEQARSVIAAARFHPKGNRGVCRFVRAANYGTKDKDAYLSDANRTVVVLQVEGLEGIGNLEEILAVPGFDILFVGPYDLSQSVGKPGQIHDEEVLKLIGEIAAMAQEKGVALGVFTDTDESIRAMASRGFSYLAHSVDQDIFSQACARVVSAVD